MKTMRLALTAALFIAMLGLSACGGNSFISNQPMPDWGRVAHEEANDKGP